MGEDEIQDAVDAYKRTVASAGGKARAKKLSAKAAAKARSKRARERKKKL